MGSVCFKPRAEDRLSVSGNNKARTVSSSSFSVSNNGGYATHSGPSKTRAGIINPRASELGRNAGYAQEPYTSSSSRHAASFSNISNDLWGSASYTLPPYVPSSTPPTTCRSKTNELARSSGYAHPTTTTTSAA